MYVFSPTIAFVILSTGGLSYAKYENIVTTFKAETEGHKTNSKSHLSLGLDAEVNYKSFLCKGAGYGMLGFGLKCG